MGFDRKYIWLGLLALVFLIFPLVFTLPFPRHVLIMIFLYATLGLAWNMIGGYAVFFIVMVIYLASLVLRYRNMQRDLATLEELEQK